MKSLAVVALTLMLTVAGCAHGGTAAARSAGSSAGSSAGLAAGPSAAAKLACSDDAVGDVSTSLGVRLTEPLAPTWSNHVYSCRYVFAAGVMVLSVSDNPDAGSAVSAFTAGRPASAITVPGLGQQAYARPDGSAVVRKDASILTVDVSGLPAWFGVPPHPRNIDATTVADTILACWIEDL